MTRTLGLALLAIAAVSACAKPTPEQTLLMAYFPKERFLENIRKRNLKVDRILPLHATIAPFSDLVKTQAATP